MILFVFLNLINVVLGTMRSILTVKATPTVAMIINTVSYTFYSGIVKLISGYNLWIVLATTAVTNIVGVYIAKFITNLMEKEKLYVFDITGSHEIFKFKERLDILKIGYSLKSLMGTKDYNITVYAYTKRDTERVKRLLKSFEFRYNIMSSNSYSSF